MLGRRRWWGGEGKGGGDGRGEEGTAHLVPELYDGSCRQPLTPPFPSAHPYHLPANVNIEHSLSASLLPTTQPSACCFSSSWGLRMNAGSVQLWGSFRFALSPLFLTLEPFFDYYYYLLLFLCTPLPFSPPPSLPFPFSIFCPFSLRSPPPPPLNLLPTASSPPYCFPCSTMNPPSLPLCFPFPFPSLSFHPHFTCT